MASSKPGIAPSMSLAPALDPAVRALLHTAGCAATWAPYMGRWSVTTPQGKSFYVKKSLVTVDEWRSTLAAMLPQPGPEKSIEPQDPNL